MEIFKWLDSQRHRVSKAFRLWRRIGFARDVEKVLGPDFTLIANNCFGARFYQDLGLEYNTPTVGLFFMMGDFVEFCSDLPHYLQRAELTFTKQSKWPQAMRLRAERNVDYPIGVLDGKVEIHFLHYPSEEEARDKWTRRAERVNFDNIALCAIQIYEPSEEEMKAFDNLPFDNKWLFTAGAREGLKSAIPMPRDRKIPDSPGDGIRNTRRFYKRWSQFTFRSRNVNK